MKEREIRWGDRVEKRKTTILYTRWNSAYDTGEELHQYCGTICSTLLIILYALRRIPYIRTYDQSIWTTFFMRLDRMGAKDSNTIPSIRALHESYSQESSGKRFGRFVYAACIFECWARMVFGIANDTATRKRRSSYNSFLLNCLHISL